MLDETVTLEAASHTIFPFSLQPQPRILLHVYPHCFCLFVCFTPIVDCFSWSLPIWGHIAGWVPRSTHQDCHMISFLGVSSRSTTRWSERMLAELVRGEWATADTHSFIPGWLWKLGKFFRVIWRWCKEQVLGTSTDQSLHAGCSGRRLWPWAWCVDPV